MWDQYKKTFRRAQLVILAVTLGVGIWSRSPLLAARFFFVMQVGSAAGVIWGTRLRLRFFPEAGRLPGRLS